MDAAKLERLRNKWLLVDTSVWMKVAKYGPSIQKPLFDIAEEYSCIFTVHDLIIQEFLSYTITQEAFDARYDWIGAFPTLPITRKETELAIHITRIYAINKLKSPSVCDALSAALLRKYCGKLYLLTNDIKDFPIALFNPFEIWPFEDGHGNELFAFYEYDEQRFSGQENKLEKAAR